MIIPIAEHKINPPNVAENTLLTVPDFFATAAPRIAAKAGGRIIPRSVIKVILL
jgi:hypothetical protein